MTRLIRRTFLVACLVGAIAATAFVGVASANYSGGVDVTCTSATYNYSTFPGGTQSMHETVWVDGALAAEKFFDFTGPTGADTLSFTVPNDGAPHQIEANSYSITNGDADHRAAGDRDPDVRVASATATSATSTSTATATRLRHHRHRRHLHLRRHRHRHRRLRRPRACAPTRRASIATTRA